MSPFEQVTVNQAQINLWIQGAIALGSFGVVVFALWGDRIKDRWFGPKLTASVQLEPPYCQRITHDVWFRIRIGNDSEKSAENVEVWLTKLWKKENKKFWITALVPIPLKWTHTDSSVARSINPSFHRYCDFGVWSIQRTIENIYQSKTVSAFSLATALGPANDAHILVPGSYRATIIVTASNADPSPCVVEFEVPPDYIPVEREALNAVNLQLVAD